MRKKLLRLLSLACILATLMTVLSGCVNHEVVEITSVEQLNDSERVVAVSQGSTGMFVAEAELPNARKKSFNTDADAYLSVASGKVDAYVYDRTMMEFALGNGLEGVKLLDENIGEPEDISIGISRIAQIPSLTEKANKFIAELKDDGTLNDMYRRWVTECDNTMPQISKAENPQYTLRVGTTGLIQPFSYYEGLTLTGHDIELIYRFAYWLNADVELKTYDFGGIVAAAEGGEIDCIITNFNATEERKQRLDFSVEYLKSYTAAMVKDFNTNEDEEFYTLSDLNGKRFACQTGTVFDQSLKQEMEGADDFYYFNNVFDQIMALKSNRVDAVCLDDPVAQLVVNSNEGIKILPETITDSSYALAFQKGSPLTEQFSNIIIKFKNDGTLDALMEKWLGADANIKVLPEQTWPGNTATISYFHDNVNEPMSYVGSGGESLGLELEIVLLIAKELDIKVEMTSCNFEALIPALQSKKADVITGSLTVTQERMEKVDFSEPFYEGALVLVVRDNDSETKVGDFWTEIVKSFNSTFVVEDRWKLVVSGLCVTIIISIASGILGIVLGFGICILRMARNKPSRIMSATFVRIIQGMPTVVFLMILYYVIFGTIDISAIMVSIIGFSINFGAYSSEMMRAGIETTDPGQREAAYAMGYTRAQTFWKIVFPQAARNFLPVLRGEFVSMVKMTSIVGYIAVQDLTKVSDIIRSRTMEAFFPLIVTAIIYFAISNLMTMVLTYFERRVDPSRKKKTIKGVKIS